MVIHRYTRLLTRIHGYTWLYAVIHGYTRLNMVSEMVIHGNTWICTATHGNKMIGDLVSKETVCCVVGKVKQLK